VASCFSELAPIKTYLTEGCELHVVQN